MNVTYITKDGAELFTYSHLSSSEVSGKLLTNYFVKNSTVYENKGATEKQEHFYVTIEEVEKEEPYLDAKKYEQNIIGLEYRAFNEGRRIIKNYGFHSHDELLPYLLVLKPSIEEKLYTRCSLEWDADRNVYVLYLV